ncbi:MAG: hypothetical protein ACE15F_13105 [bacterium]
MALDGMLKARTVSIRAFAFQLLAFIADYPGNEYGIVKEVIHALEGGHQGLPKPYSFTQARFLSEGFFHAGCPGLTALSPCAEKTARRIDKQLYNNSHVIIR